MKRIVVGVDGSRPSQEALRWAVDEARAHDAELDVVMVYQPAGVNPAAPATLASSGQLEAEAQEKLAFMLSEIAGDDDPVVRPIAVSGHPPTALLETARGADMLVVGSRGSGALVGGLLGSVSQRCVTHSDGVVVVVHPHDPGEAPGEA